MANKTTRITANITARIDGLRKGVDEGSKKLEAFASKTEKLSARASAAGKKLTQNMTLPILAVAGASTKFASDLSESLGKAEVLFGNNAGEIEAWADDAALAFGQSKRQALDAASGFKQIFDGWPEDKATEASQTLTELASDIGSFNNASVDDVLGALEAGLRGEAEPLRRFGVNLNTATIEAKALELGLISQGEAMTDQAKEQAALAIIMEQTTTAQGDFARTADGAANKTKILKAQAEDLGAKFGTKLLPVAVKVLGWASNLIEKFSGLSDTWQTVILVAGGFVAAIGPVLIVVGKLSTAIKGVSTAMTFLGTHPMVGVGLAVAALAIGLVVLYKKNERFRSGVQKIAKFLQEKFGPVLAEMVEWFGEKIPPTLERTRDGFQKVTDFFETKVLPVMEKIVGFVGDYVIPVMVALGTAFFDANVKVIETVASIVSVVAGLPGSIKNKAVEMFDAAKELGSQFLEGLKNALTNAVGFASDVASGVLTAVKNVVNGVIDSINSALEFTIDFGFGSFTVNPRDLPHLAQGTSFFSGGAVTVGENGPEDVFLPKGSQVVPSHSSSQGMAGGGVNVYVDSGADPDEIARALDWTMQTSGRGYRRG